MQVIDILLVHDYCHWATVQMKNNLKKHEFISSSYIDGAVVHTVVWITLHTSFFWVEKAQNKLMLL